MLHEEVDLRWEELIIWIQDFQFLEKLRPELIVGVSIYSFIHFILHSTNIKFLIILQFHVYLGHNNIYWNSSTQSRGAPESNVPQRDRSLGSRCFYQRDRLKLVKIVFPLR